MPNGVKLDAPKQIIIDKTQPVCQSMGPEGKIQYWSSLCNFHLRHRYGAYFGIKINKIFHIRSTQN